MITYICNTETIRSGQTYSQSGTHVNGKNRMVCQVGDHFLVTAFSLALNTALAFKVSTICLENE